MHRLFSLNKQPINYSCEMMGGLINFLAIAYIIAVNPMIVNAGGHGFPLNASITATIVTIIIMTTLAGFIIKLPFVVAPGMGMNAMVSYTLVLHDKLPIPRCFRSYFLVECYFICTIRNSITPKK